MHRPHAGLPPRPSPDAARSDRIFGGVFFAFFLLVGCSPLLRGGSIRGWAIATAGVVGLLALVAPRSLALPHRLWLRWGDAMHRIVSPVALAVVYGLGIVPIALVYRLLGQDPLRRARRADAASFWIARGPARSWDEQLRRQF